MPKKSREKEKLKPDSEGNITLGEHKFPAFEAPPRQTVDVSKLESILKNGANYDSERSYCTGGCRDYCRCSRITNTKITSVYIEQIIEELSYTLTDEFLKYAIDRVIRLSGLQDTSKWTVRVRGGYYGEETDGVELDSLSLSALQKDLTAINTLSNKERIEFLLTKEYGYLLESVKECVRWEIVTVKRTSLILPNQERLFYVRKMDTALIESYVLYKRARGIAIKDENKFRLIDGYHRISATDDEELKLIVGYKD
jgi:hypothetical protein